MKNQVLVFIIAILLISNINTRHRYRKLVNEQTKEKACKKADQNYKKPEFTSLSSYVNSIVSKNQNMQDLIQGLLLTGAVTQFASVLSEIMIYIIIIGLGVILLLMWPLLLCCCCCSCCMFKSKDHPSSCRFVWFIIAVSLEGVILALSITGLILSGKFMTYFNGSSCSLLNFFDHTVMGEEKETLPKWGGTSGIQQSLLKSMDTISKVSENSNSLYTSGTYSSIETSTSTIGTEFTDFIKYYTESTNPFNSEKPEYLDQLIKLDESTWIGKVYKDYQTSVYQPFQIYKDLKDPLNALGSSKNLSNELNSASQSVNDLGDLIDSISDSIATNFVDIQDTISKYIVLVFNVVFGFFTAMSAIIILLSVLFVFFQLGFLKIIIHIIWNFSFLFIFGSLIIGGILGIVGLVGGQIAPVLNFILSPSYLNSAESIFGSGGPTTTYIDICLNGDGNLLSQLPIPTKDTETLDKVYSLSQKMDLLENLMVPGTSSPAAQEMLDTLTSYYNDLGNVKIKGGSTIAELMQGCSGLTTKRNGGSNFIVDHCGSNPQTPSCNINSHCDFVNKVDTDLKNLINENNQNSSPNNFQKLKNDLNQGIGYSKTQLEGTKKLTDSMVNAFGSILGESGSFSDLLNCGFIKEDLIVFCDQFSHIFSSTSKTLCYICTLTSIFSFMGVFFIASTLSGYSGNLPSPGGIIQSTPRKIEMASFNQKPGSSEFMRVIK